MKPVPIRRKGCKNVGWVWNESKTEKLVVPLHIGKPLIWLSETFVYPPPINQTYIFAEDYSAMLPVVKKHKWYQFWK